MWCVKNKQVDGIVHLFIPRPLIPPEAEEQISSNIIHKLGAEVKKNISW
jgi:hypothetical protein